MLFSASSAQDVALFTLRRKDLVQAIQEQYKTTRGMIVLFAGFESDKNRFRQESTFYYLTGIQEPGVVVTIDMQGKTILYVPNYGTSRSQWVASDISHDNPAAHGLDAIKVLGEQCPGYQFNPLCPQKTYNNILTALKDALGDQGNLFVLLPSDNAYVEQQCILGRFLTWLPELQKNVIDISPFIATLRRRKDMREIEMLYKAIEITQLAQEAAAQAIEPDTTESEVQASLEYIMTASGARPAFPSIVASGKNATVLHYMLNSATIQPGDLVVVDIGAEYGYYCADLTRTYPASGTFTKRQRELYDIVLETQEHVAEHARPGMWLSNKEHPDQSLHHLALKFLAKKGYDKYFVHNIGHFLGIDVHDVGDTKKPLQEGDVITIEPGIYIPEEGIGIRIEDNYWIVKDGVVCLSDSLPKKAEDIEDLVQQNWQEKEEELAEDEEETEEEYLFEEEDEIDTQVKH